MPRHLFPVAFRNLMLQPARIVAPAIALLGGPAASADVVTEWNARAGEFVVAAGLANQPAHRVLAISHTAAFEAANAITRRYPSPLVSAGPSRTEAPSSASVDAAIVAAHCGVLVPLLPTQKPAIEGACRTALNGIANGAAKDAGVEVGERAARAVIARRADDGAAAAESYRPFSAPGRYVPTTMPASPHWPQRKPWLMSNPAQFRSAPPPALDSDRWARDYNEIKATGGARSAQRSPEQTDIARFWETSHPSIYHALVRGVAELPGRDVMRNVRLFAAFTQAIDDGMIAVFDAKYHYGFWRPITAIRNGDIDGNDQTERDASWTPLVPTPMHPEYPCAHCMQAGVVGAILAAEFGGTQPMLTTTSPTAKGASRRWTNLDAFVQEVSDARIWDGVHYRFSSEAGADMGRKVGALAVARFLGD